MKKIKIAVLPGDGIGQEVTHSVLPIFNALNIPVDITFGEIGWECWRKEGNAVPASTWKLIEESDVTLLGAITSKPDREAVKELPEHLKSSPPTYISPVIQLRQQLDLYANVRPCINIKGSGDDFNFCVIRENTEGLYAGFDFYPLTDSLKSIVDEKPRWSSIPADEISCSLRLQSKSGLKRLFEFSFDYANKQGYSRVTFADKPNVLRKSSAFAREIFESIAKQYPHIEADILNIDAVALWMVKRPQEFGVIVAENMFGDILSDLGAGVMGGLGFAPSANKGVKGSYFEPVHGSAPRVKQNSANPSAMFLTVGLLLEEFGYHEESARITQAVKDVVRESKHVTYDLGGKASTQDMSKAIIDHCLHPKIIKSISILATGNEIIEGEIQDTNSNYFAKQLNIKGANIYQHLQVSDKKHEIAAGLRHLLAKSDVVLVTGGLGPTSDDCTRFAVSDVTHKQLNFDEKVWGYIEERLRGFNLPITDENKQQALFPEGAIVLENKNGTACGCYLKWQDKYIFMLPGPPNECRPMFESMVIPVIENLNLFSKKNKYSWLTLGLIEAEVAAEIDKIIQGHSVEASYRWSYPYVEIKLVSQDADISHLINNINQLLSPYVISDDGQTAFEKMDEVLESFPNIMHVKDNVSTGSFHKLNQHACTLKFVDKNQEVNSHDYLIHIERSAFLNSDDGVGGSITLRCKGYKKGKIAYENAITIPNRGIEVKESINAYIAWQIGQFIKSSERLS